MLMTHIAILDAGDPQPGILERLVRRLVRFFRPEYEEEQVSSPELIETTMDVPALRLVTAEVETIHPQPDLRWRRHPQLLIHAPSDLPLDEREARHEAVRGLFAARAGALECAAEYFARAAEHPGIDLTAVPGFWNLDRSAMLTAVEAYERVGRIRDAAALNARIRSMYRPRAISSVPPNVVRMCASTTKASSTS